ncbi:TPA: ead/Ea22-like family protein [Enterobacter bugandensis]|uniref:ead/Ea22-like family protein n=1 Tax=Enterobacter bugandensis TaxID=881260 RepID=UPI0005ECCDE9|nr:ead/Ea22-like family protein [Enterobacter bugandensis]KJN35156.1 hypothetical protein SS14_04625 [Enterobacter bugandensis]
MSKIDKRALRESAEGATQGPWVEKRGEVTTADYEVEGATYLDHICNCEIIGTESPNAEFIAAANPATVLALLDELEAAKKRIAELEAKLETADKLQDSAFRHGLQHGFSLGQTDNQAGFEECLLAYSQKEKSNG